MRIARKGARRAQNQPKENVVFIERLTQERARCRLRCLPWRRSVLEINGF